MKNILLIGMLLLSLPGYSQKFIEGGSDELCSLNNIQLDRKVVLGTDPEYFFKPVPNNKENENDDKVSVILGGANFFLDMNTGKTKQIPGPYDGVPTPDGEFIVSPALGGHITFYDRNNINLKSTDKPTFDDKDEAQGLMGVYHSLGILYKKNNNDGSRDVTYRAITDTVTTSADPSDTETDEGKLLFNTLKFKDYTMNIKADGTKVLVKDSGESKLLCSNFKNKVIKTPIISKNGRMLSAYNMETGTSVIYNIKKGAGGKSICELKKDLGVATSKMEFSPRGNKVVFAVNSLPTTPATVDWYETPPVDTHNMNVFVYDLNSDKLSKMSHQGSGNSYYPSFSKNGASVVWLSQELKGVGENGEPVAEYSVKRASIDNAPKTNFINQSKLRRCNQSDPISIKNMALGKLWESVCSSLSLPMTLANAATIPLSYNKESCKELVNSSWDRFLATAPEKMKVTGDTGNVAGGLGEEEEKFYLEKFLSLKKEDLLSTCDGTKSIKFKKVANTPVVSEKVVVKELFRNPLETCTQCHSSGANKIPFEDPEKMKKWKRKALLHVMTGSMPRNMTISQDKRDAILEKLYEIEDE
jgi:hypothetical protein